MARAVWGYSGAAFLAIASIGGLAARPFTFPPVTDRPAGIVFAPGLGVARAIEAIGHADPSARILDISWHGTVVYVRYVDRHFPETIKQLGALHAFDAVAAGCHVRFESTR